MEAYEVTQALMSVGTVYHVRRRRSEDVLFAIKGELMSPTPRFQLVEGQGDGDAEPVAQLVGNFIKTRYEIQVGGEAVGSVTFPAVAFKKTLSLAVGAERYEADGGVFRGVFRCTNERGEVALEIAKELSIRDTFVVKPTEAMPLAVGLLAAVAIHSRFYEMV